MAKRKGQLRLGAFFNPTGHHVASWRHPDAQADANVNFQHYVEVTQTAERGKFDMVFLADNLAMREASMEALSRSAQYISNLEPMTLIAALSAVASIGLVCTATTSYYEPYHVARSSRRWIISVAVTSAGISSRRARSPRPTISTATLTSATPSATTARASSPKSWSGCGIHGTTMPLCATRKRASFSILPSSTRSTTSASTSKLRGRSTPRVRRRAIR